ncbi:E3 ubiquitin-protein ligase marchf7 [Xenoophorus captivus]|uniref:RING-type E3 ubiquitin transferase n=1 Tax=Xenoophorus captivus TaxID=1517983 RepID=A0ABV0Q4E9_9TELE
METKVIISLCCHRLLMEDSDEEEGDLCRICQMQEESSSNPLIQPCRCTGSLQYVHQECIKRWLRSKISSGKPPLSDICTTYKNCGTNLEAITTCELCKEKLRLNIDNFDIQELYRTHVQVPMEKATRKGSTAVRPLTSPTWTTISKTTDDRNVT